MPARSAQRVGLSAAGTSGHRCNALSSASPRIAVHARLGCTVHERELRVGADDGDRALGRHAPRSLDAVEARHLHVEHGKVRLVLARELDILLPVVGLGAYFEAGPLQQLTQVEPDERLVLCDQDPHEAAFTSSVPSSRRLMRSAHSPPWADGTLRRTGFNGFSPTARNAPRRSVCLATAARMAGTTSDSRKGFTR